jgi:hypothetical protein
MRVALCLSGQPRKALETYKYIKSNIIDPNDCDVFMFMNFDNENRYIEKSHKDKACCEHPPETDKKLVELYKPKRFLIEGQKEFNTPNLKVPENRIKRSQSMNSEEGWSREQHRNYTVRQMVSMFYGIFKCNELKETYSLENGFTYDYVIRMRYDLAPLKTLKLKKFDSNYIYYLEMGHKDHLISDWLNFGSNVIMNIYSSIYLHMEYLNSFSHFKKEDRLDNTLEPSDECGGLYEHMIRDIMTLFKIQKKGIYFSHRMFY